MQVVATGGAPKALGPYSQGIVANGFVFTAGIGELCSMSAESYSFYPLLLIGNVEMEKQAEEFQLRSVADQAFREAAARLRELAFMRDARQRLADAEDTVRAIEAFRIPWPFRASCFC